MSKTEDQTREKILLSALALFAERGIYKTSVYEVAYRAGVTRITVYRYFSDKKELVRQVHLRVEQVFQKGLNELERDPQADWESVLKQIGEELSGLPSGDVAARADELKRLYPDVYRSIQEVRVATLKGIFDHIIEAADRQGLLRPNLNRSIVEAVFWELVINFFDNPRFKSFGLSDAELYRAMTDIIGHGIFTSSPATINVESPC
jgi:AcrR family transcriptional regulator